MQTPTKQPTEDTETPKEKIALNEKAKKKSAKPAGEVKAEKAFGFAS